MKFSEVREWPSDEMKKGTIADVAFEREARYEPLSEPSRKRQIRFTLATPQAAQIWQISGKSVLLGSPPVRQWLLSRALQMTLIWQ